MPTRLLSKLESVLSEDSNFSRRVANESTLKLSPASNGCHLGTVVLEACEPFFVLSQDGHAASILGRCSSDMMGKMLKSLELEAGLDTNLPAAAWECLRAKRMTYRIAKCKHDHSGLLLVFMFDDSGKRPCVRMFIQRLDGVRDYDAISQRLHNISLEISK